MLVRKVKLSILTSLVRSVTLIIGVKEMGGCYSGFPVMLRLMSADCPDAVRNAGCAAPHTGTHKSENAIYSTIKGFVDNNDCRCSEPVSRQVDQGDRASLSSLLSRWESRKVRVRPARHALNQR
jgi:hypothetical protein